jgi:hypothetical protein
MNTTRKIGLAIALAGGLLAAGAAHARPDVAWSVTIGGGSPIYAPAPPVALPMPPRIGVPVYPGVVYPGVVHPARWDHDGDGVPNRYDRYDNRRHHPPHYGHGHGHGHGYGHGYGRGDHDRDGVPNRHDRHDHNPRRW